MLLNRDSNDGAKTASPHLKIDETESVSSAASDAKESTNNKMNLYEEALHFVGMSEFVYMYSFQRDQSKRGLSKFDFDAFAIESDKMTDRDIFRNVPLKLKPRSTYSVDNGTVTDELIQELGGITMVQLYVRGMQVLAEYGFPSASSENQEEDGGEKKVGELSEGPKMVVTNKNSKSMDVLAKNGLKYADPDESKHVGQLQSKMGLHYYQCAFDQMYEKATKDKDPLYVKIKELYERPRTKKGQEGANDISIEDQDLIQHMMKDMYKETYLHRLVTSTLGSSEILVWINDRSKEECVYLIFVNPVRKRITVVFRGTVTLEDLMKNIKYKVFEMRNPIREEYEGKTSTVELKQGYCEYLFMERIDNGRTKYDEISDRVYMFAEHLWGNDPQFELCVSGHSLGGAMASLFSFKASTDPRFVKEENPKPIRTFTYGGALTGRVSFAKAFQHQEEVGKLMHLRVVMKRDVVPSMRPLQVRDAAHTGYEMKLETKLFGEGEDEAGKKRTPPKYKYIHDKSWWKTHKGKRKTNVFVKCPWYNPKLALAAHKPTLYLKALWEAKVDGQISMSSGAADQPKGKGGKTTLPVDHHNWTLDEHYVQMKIRKSKSALGSVEIEEQEKKETFPERSEREEEKKEV